MLSQKDKQFKETFRMLARDEMTKKRVKSISLWYA